MSRRSQTGLKAKSAPAPMNITGRRKVIDRSFLHGTEAFTVSSIVHEVLRSPGQPLDPTIRALMAPRFGHDLSKVRIHNNAKAGESTHSIKALAYTLGRHIVFGAGQYRPDSSDGRRLIAHELVHTLQQSQDSAGALQSSVSGITDACEQEADRIASDLFRNKTVSISQHHPMEIQRKVMPGRFDLTYSADPMMARIIGSVTIDGFVTGKADVSQENEQKLKETAETIVKLFKTYPGSTVRIIGHTDAVDTEEYNEQLGLKRAEAVKSTLTRMGVSADSITTKSRGELELLVQTKKAEPRNRRVEVRFEPFVMPQFMPKLELIPPKVPSEPFGKKTPSELYPPTPAVPGYPPYSPSIPGYPPWLYQGPIPPIPEKPKNWLEEGLKRDPIIKKLPKWAREKAIGALKDADEKAADKIIDALPLDSKEKAALKAVVKALLQTLKGKKFKMPTPPLHEPPPSPFKGFPKMPGEKIFTLPPWRF